MTSILRYSGVVIKGLQNGRKFGFPTANLHLDDQKMLIEKGVYAIHIFLKNNTLNGMLYVGTRPTLNLSNISVEINIFDFNEDIYDEKLSFSVIKKIRDEKKFENTAALIQQLKSDQHEAMQILGY